MELTAVEQSLISSETEVVDRCPEKSKQNLCLIEKCAFLNHVRSCLTCSIVWDVPGETAHRVTNTTWKDTIIFYVTGEFRMQLIFTLLFTCSWVIPRSGSIPTPLSSIFCLQSVRIKSKEWRWTDEYSYGI